jgi:hypothetical protein
MKRKRRNKMKKRMCKFQDTILETGRLGIHISRCLNKECSRFLTGLNEEICDACSYRMPVDINKDKSLAKDIFDVDLIQRSDQLVSHLYNTYCKQCEYFDQHTKMCISQKCNFTFPVDIIMRCPSVNCPLELW